MQNCGSFTAGVKAATLATLSVAPSGIAFGLPGRHFGAVAGITAPCNIAVRDPDLVSASSVPVRVVTTQLSSGKVDIEIFVLPTVMLDVRLRLQRQFSRQFSSQRWQHLYRRQAQSARHIEQPATAIKAVGEQTGESDAGDAVDSALTGEPGERGGDAVRLIGHRVGELLCVGKAEIQPLRRYRM